MRALKCKSLSVPVGRANRGDVVWIDDETMVRRWGHPSMLDGALQTLNVNGWVAPLVPAKWTRFRLTLGCARRDYHHVILSRRTNQLQSIPWKRSGIGMILFGSHTPPCRMPHQSIRCNTPSRIRLVQCPHCFEPTVEVARR